MICILLAAGYATRLYPLTKDKPKSLLEVGGSSILTHIVRKIECVEQIDEIYIVTNDRFYELFQAWVETYSTSKRIKVHEMQLPQTFIDYCKSKIGKSTRYLMKEAIYEGEYNNEWKLVLPEGLFDIREQEDGNPV